MFHNLEVRTKTILLASMLAMIIVVATSLLAWQMLQHTRAELEQRLHTSLDSSIIQVKQELNKHKAIVRYWADSADLLFATVTQLKNKPRTHRADSNDPLDELLAASLEQLNYRDYKIIDQHGVILTSGSGHDVGKAVPEELEHNVILAWRGIAQVTRPFAATRAWKDIDGWVLEDLSTMMSFSPIVDSKGDTIALLAFEFDPDRVYNPLFHHSWMGVTGETYGIDRNGLLLTQIKYADQLAEIGLIEDSASVHPALKLKMLDPGFNLVKDPSAINKLQDNRPLTFMAKAIQQDQDGSNVYGYADYRGVPVIGAWRWDNELQMGIVTEVDVDEAFYLYRSTIQTMPIGVAVLILVIFATAGLYLRIAKKTRQFQQQRDAIFKQTADGIITIDDKGIVTIANPAASKIFGYSIDEMKGQNVSMLMPESERVVHDEYLRSSSLHEPKIMNLSRELRGQTKDGHHFPLELTVSPMILEGKKFYVGVLRDVTLRYRHQQDLIAAKNEAELAKDIAERANRAKSEFLSKMSHELRTPLNAILGFSQLLAVDSLTEDQIDSVNLITSSGKHLLNLINDVLDLAQIESGNMMVSLENVSIRDLITDITPVIETQLDDLQLSLTTRFFTEEMIWVTADYLRLKQVLLNLLSNAVKYNQMLGNIEIEVSQLTGDMARISIKDTGYGIAPELQEGLFEPFNRLGNDHSEIQGTGIGLVISRELTRLMGGELGVESVAGTGSTFWIDLPLEEGETIDSLNDSEDMLKQHEQMLAEHEEMIKVLYIEDNPANMTLVRQLFIRFPLYQLLEAETAEEGLETARKLMPDIVLMDINLPEMSGFEALEIMKEEGLTEKMKVVALSANALVSEVERGYEAGFDYYLTKPIDFKKLLETLKEVYPHISNK